jgi:Fur family transcriptional regulator, ferric uptake regulator
MTPVERFKKYLAKQNLRMTVERRKVVEEIFSTAEHFTVSDLVQRMQANDSSMGRSTVYRVIPLLLKAGMIFEVSVRGGREEQVYENTSGIRHHAHMTCEVCGEVIEFNDSEIHEIQEKIATRYGYKLKLHIMDLRGICPSCQEQIISREVSAW